MYLVHNGFTRQKTILEPEFLVSYRDAAERSPVSVAIDLEDIPIEATYHPHKNIAGFPKTLYINTSTYVLSNSSEDKP
jgi:hypothetical protein